MASLTDKRIRNLQAPAKGRRLVFDNHREAPRGFGLRVNAGGTKTFILRYRVEGRDRQANIGEFPTWSLAAARKRGEEMRRQVDAGRDLLEERRKERAEPTVAEAVERFCRAHADKLASAKDVRGNLTNHLTPALGKRKLRSIRRREIIELLEGLRDRPRQAALLLTYSKQLFAWAEDRELIDANPVATLKPGKVAPELAPRSRARILTEAELSAFWANAETCGMRRLTALALKFVLVTGQRPGEVAGMAWSEVDGDTWTVPGHRRGKTETDHRVPLTETAREILEAARAEVQRLSRRREEPPAGFVFESRPSAPLTPGTLAQAVHKAPKALGNRSDAQEGPWRPHDLRRTMRTGLAAAGVDELTAELTVGHTRKGIAAVYDLHKYDHEKRRALEAWERRLLSLVGQPVEATVVSLSRPEASK